LGEERREKIEKGKVRGENAPNIYTQLTNEGLGGAGRGFMIRKIMLSKPREETEKRRGEKSLGDNLPDRNANDER